MTRTNTVYQSAEVYHLWAHQTQAEARNHSGSMSFRGRDAYSYGLVIGRIITNSRGERAILVNTDGYSPTTANHISDLRRAIRHEENVLPVGCIADPETMIDQLLERID